MRCGLCVCMEQALSVGNGVRAARVHLLAVALIHEAVVVRQLDSAY